MKTKRAPMLADKFIDMLITAHVATLAVMRAGVGTIGLGFDENQNMVIWWQIPDDRDDR